MWWFISVLVFASLTGILQLFKVTKEDKDGKIKLTNIGRFHVICSFLIIPASIAQYVSNERDIDQEKEVAKASQVKRDSVLFIRYNSSLNQMKEKSDSNNLEITSNITEILGKYGYMLDTTNRRLVKLGNPEAIKNDILNWDKKDETIFFISRIMKLSFDRIFPLGYKVFKSGGGSFRIPFNDTIFSNKFTANLSPVVDFDYSRNEVQITITDEIITDRTTNKVTQKNNVFITPPIQIPKVGEIVHLNFILSNGRELCFYLVDDKPKDEIYLFGYMISERTSGRRAYEMKKAQEALEKQQKIKN